MKYTIKGYEKKEISFEVEADNMENAFSKAFNMPLKEFSVTSINDHLVTSSLEAKWADRKDIFNNAIRQLKSEYEQELHTLKEVFKLNNGVKYFNVLFSGSGDDGCIDDVQAVPYALNNIVTENVGKGTINDIVQAIVNVLLDDIPIDWVNDKGGNGSIQLALNEKDEFEFTVNCCEYEEIESTTFHKVFSFK